MFLVFISKMAGGKDLAQVRIVQRQKANTRWATAPLGTWNFRGIFLSTIARSLGRKVVVGLLCSLCKQHQTKQRNSVGTWTEKPCNLLRRDILQCHKDSNMHKEAAELEAARLASRRNGGIKQAFSACVVVQRNALIGALQLMYWLAKEEVAHTTKFNSLAIRFGCMSLVFEEMPSTPVNKLSQNYFSASH